MEKLEIPELPPRKPKVEAVIEEIPAVEELKEDSSEQKIQELNQILANAEFLTNPLVFNLALLQKLESIGKDLEDIKGLMKNGQN